MNTNLDKMNILYAMQCHFRTVEALVHICTSHNSRLNLAFLNTPCTYPRRSYLESLHSDAHCVPYLCPSRGHQEFRTLWSSWNEREREKKKRQRSSYWAWSANLVWYLFCHRGRETNTISCQLRSRAERRGTCSVFHPKDCAGFIPSWREKELNWVDTHY